MEESVDFYSCLCESFGQTKKELGSYSPLVLAYIGDTVYDLIIRSMLIADGNTSVEKLHRRATDHVKAAGQAKLMECIQEKLGEEEAEIYRRGKNAKFHTLPKNATPQDYHRATGCEALFGWLYLQGKTERILELAKLGLDRMKEAAEENGM